MHDDLTKRHQAILDFIRREIRTRGYPPSVREIGEAVGLRSSSTVHGHLSQLEEKGYLRRDPSKPRAIEVLEDNQNLVHKEIVPVPVVGRVAAGVPILATENVEDTFPLPFEFLRTRDAFMLLVKGTSMIDAGILDGDYVVVRQQATASDGDIVAALLEEEATIKRFYKEQDHIRLQPENPAMEPIYTTDARILGKVIGVFRRLQ